MKNSRCIVVTQIAQIDIVVLQSTIEGMTITFKYVLYYFHVTEGEEQNNKGKA